MSWIDDLVPPGSVREVLHQRTLRRKLRYWCFRLRSEVEGISDAEAPSELVDLYEDQQWFDGWGNFGATWDLDEEDPLVVVPRWRTIHEEWDEVIQGQLQRNQIESRKNLRKAAVDGNEVHD